MCTNVTCTGVMRIETAVLATDITGTFEHAVLHACGSNDGEVAWSTRNSYFGYAIMTPKAMRWSSAAARQQQLVTQPKSCSLVGNFRRRLNLNTCVCSARNLGDWVY